MTREEIIGGLTSMAALLEGHVAAARSVGKEGVAGFAAVNRTIIIEALALLMDDEPRLLTAEDFIDNPRADYGGDVPVYVEDRSGYCEWMCMDAERFDRNITASNFYRGWSDKPTDEQRKATPWTD